MAEALWCRRCRCVVHATGRHYIATEQQCSPADLVRHGYAVIRVVCTLCFHRARLQGFDLTQPAIKATT